MACSSYAIDATCSRRFEELVRGPEPWLYAHVQLPGGRDNIGNPDYDLKNETSLAPRTGTLMRVARYEKQPDNRWAVWVQGLARCRVEKALRNMPYARADVRIIPDGEAFSHFGGTSAFPECWSAALLEDEAFARVEFLPPPESDTLQPRKKTEVDNVEPNCAQTLLQLCRTCRSHG